MYINIHAIWTCIRMSACIYAWRAHTGIRVRAQLDTWNIRAHTYTHTHVHVLHVDIHGRTLTWNREIWYHTVLTGICTLTETDKQTEHYDKIKGYGHGREKERKKRWIAISSQQCITIFRYLYFFSALLQHTLYLYRSVIKYTFCTMSVTSYNHTLFYFLCYSALPLS